MEEVLYLYHRCTAVPVAWSSVSGEPGLAGRTLRLGLRSYDFQACCNPANSKAVAIRGHFPNELVI